MYFAVEYTRADGEIVRIDYTNEQDMRKDVARRLRSKYASKACVFELVGVHTVEDVEDVRE